MKIQSNKMIEFSKQTYRTPKYRYGKSLASRYMRLAFVILEFLYTYKPLFCSYHKPLQVLIRLARHVYKINWTHHRGFLQNDVSNFFI